MISYDTYFTTPDPQLIKIPVGETADPTKLWGQSLSFSSFGDIGGHN